MHIFRHINLSLSVLLIAAAVCGCGEKKDPAVKKVTGTKKVITDPAGASIIYNGKEIGKTPYTLKAKPKFYVVKISKHGYDDLYAPLKIQPGKNKDVSYKLVKSLSSALIVSNPSGAYITFNGKRIGETPYVISDLTTGSYVLTLSKAGYASKDISFKINSERPIKIATSLVPNIGYINIETEPSGASVSLNGEKIGITPFKGEYVDGSYEFTLNYPTYIEHKFTAVVEKGKTSNKKFKLNLMPGSFEITTTPAKAKVFWDGSYIGESPVMIKDQMANTSHILLIEAENYAPEKHRIKVSPGKKEPLHYDLKRNRGDIELVINQPGVSIFLNGKKIHEVEKDLKSPKVFSVKDLTPGVYSVRYHHHRAQPSAKTKKFKVLAGETTTVENMDLWIPNATLIYTNDSVENVIIIQESPTAYYVELEKGMRYSVPRSHLKNVNYFKD